MLNDQIKLNQTVKSNILYHYTKSNGINGIINNNCFWATKSDFLNDPKEFSYIKHIIKIVSEEIIEDVKLRDMFLEDILEIEELAASEESKDYFVLSFSNCRDSITMWSEFGSKTGYNIGFYSDEIIKRIEEKNPIEYHGFVIYNKDKQKKIVEKQFFKCVSKKDGFSLMDILKAGYENRADENYIKFCKNFQKSIEVYAMFFKNRAFKEEQEYRFVFTRPKRKYVHFREKDGFMIPYIEIPLSEELLPVKEIMVAPLNHIDLAKKGMEYMLHLKGYDVSVSLSDVKLRY